MQTKQTPEIHEAVAGILQFLKKSYKHDYKRILQELVRVSREEASTGEIISTVPIDKEVCIRIEKNISEKLKHTVVLHNKIDPSIIGGIIIKVGDMVIDESVQGKLNRLREQVYGY